MNNWTPPRVTLGTYFCCVPTEELWGLLLSGNVCSSLLPLLAGEVKSLVPSLYLLAWNPIASQLSGPFCHPGGWGEGGRVGLSASQRRGLRLGSHPCQSLGDSPSWAAAVAPSSCSCAVWVGVRGALQVFGVGSGVLQEGATPSDARWPPCPTLTPYTLSI